jgi:NADH-quinone oxidoreductase subunit E/NADP-reducing hydrogenase subunit HndA
MLIPMLQDIQAKEGYLPKAALKELSRELSVPISQIYAIATFYTSFSLIPRGDHLITLCMGTVCYLKGADKVADRIQEELGITAGETTEDKRFTFMAVNCVGACALAPVMIIDGKYYQKVQPDDVADILAEYPAPESAEK